MDRNRWNRCIYGLWAPVYDALVGLPMFVRARKRAIELLGLQAGERLFISGVGTGADLPFLPAGISVEGIDLSEAMLAKARARLPLPDREVRLVRGNAEALPFADASFDAALLVLILSVVGDPRAALRETFRVLRAGGRAVVFDKFLGPGEEPPLARRVLNCLVMRPFGTDINRRFETMLPSYVEVQSNEPAGFGGAYRMIVLRKAV